jgi:hypothetical protein
MTARVQPLSPEEIAAIPAPAVVRREEGMQPGTPRAVAAAPLDPDARLELHARPALSAAVFVVDYLGDTSANDINPGDGLCVDAFGACGLRAAIEEANALPGLDTVILPPEVITLASAGAGEDAAATGDLDITDNLIIQGAGATLSVINGNGAVTGDRVFHVLRTSGGYVTADFIDLSIRGGSITAQTGGGIAAGCRADVLVRRSNVFENFGSMGGGISVAGGQGCPANNLPRVIVYESAVYRNTANSTLAGAGVDHFGGGTLNIINSTVALNVNASASASAAGGISVSSNAGSIASIRASTIIDNSAPNATTSDGVGLRLGTSSTTTLIDNLVGFNTFSAGTANCGGSSATITSGGGNIYSIGTVTCPTNANDSTGNGFSLAAGIALNPPGQTQTAAIFASSAAREFGKSCILPQDQRGVERPLRGCSSGAYQFVIPPRPPEIFDDGFE